MGKISPRPIVVAGALPPPLNGYSLITRSIIEVARTHREVVVLDISPGTVNRGARYHLTRCVRVGHALARLIPARIRGASELYLATESRIGLVYTIVLAGVGRVLGFRVFLHHHAFRYITAWSALMAALVWLTRRNAVHIFLCACMERDFVARYGGQIQSKRLANAAFVDLPSDAPLRARERRLAVGLLSNLSDEKGLHKFLKLAEEAIAAGLPATFILAGPTTNDRDASGIARTADRLKDHFQYRGAVYDEARSKFYRDIDIFAFPTAYDNEAQPLVLYEAMAYGAAVVSSDRGCIAEQVGRAGWVVPRDDDFVRVCLDLLRHLSGDETALVSAQKNARLMAEKEHEAALDAAHDLVGSDSVAVLKATRSASGDIRATRA